MKFQVTEIEFDFTTDDGEYELQPSKQEQITNDTIGQIWEADDAEHLVDKISDETGWCIKSIDYTVFIPGILS
jgi:hypothetical protein